MLKNNRKNNGRTFPDLISENPKTFVGLLLAACVTIIIIVFSGKHIKFGSFEINNPKNNATDTVYKIDTVVQLKYDTLIFKKKSARKLLTKEEVNLIDGNTKVNIKNQPANINTGTNNGVIGNNSTLNNFGEKPFILNEATKNKLIRFLNLEIEKASKEHPTIIISGITGNKKSLDLAKKIKTFLTSKNYIVNPVIGNIMVSESSGSISIVYSEHMESILLDVDMY